MNYKLTLCYNGKNFFGWQVQPKLRTVQGELETCLSQIFNETIKTIASGRTDTGVSAINQVVNFFSEKIIKEYSLLSRLNSILPSDIKILKIEYESDSFNARFSAEEKTYAYNFYVGLVANPYLDDFCYRVKYKIDYNVLVRELKSLIGTHDFTSFSSTDTQTENKVRTIKNIEVLNNGEVITIKFTGNGFLKNMIRIIMGTAFDVARGKLKNTLTEIIDFSDRNKAGKTAGAVGLVLINVNYKN